MPATERLNILHSIMQLMSIETKLLSHASDWNYSFFFLGIQNILQTHPKTQNNPRIIISKVPEKSNW